MPRFKVIFEVIYTTDADNYEEAASKAFGDVHNGIIHMCDIKELSYATRSGEREKDGVSAVSMV